MVRFGKLLALAPALALAVFLAAPSNTARASDIVVDVYIQDAGGARHLLSQFESLTGTAKQTFASIAYGDTTFSNITISATSNQPGGSTGNLAQTNVTSDGSSGSGLLVVDVQEKQGFSSPGQDGQQLGLTSKVANSSIPGNAGLTFQSWVNATGTAFTGTSWGLQTYDGNVGGNQAPNKVTTAFVRGTSYWLSNELTVGAGDNALNVSGTTTVATPAPAGIVLALAGVPCLGAGAWLRRRRQAA